SATARSASGSPSSRNEDGVARTQDDVLAQVLAAFELLVVDVDEGFGGPAFRQEETFVLPYDDDAVRLCVFTEAAGQGEALEHGGTPPQWKIAWPGHLAEHVEAAARRRHEADRDLRRGEKALQRLRDLDGELLRGPSGGLCVAQERDRHFA